MKTRTEPFRKITFSMPRHMADFANTRATELGRTRSGYIQSLIRREQRRKAKSGVAA